MQRILLAPAMMATASLAGADALVQRWGVPGHVQHPRTVKIEPAKTGKLMTFDLSALPAKATVHRARPLFRAIGRYYEPERLVPKHDAREVRYRVYRRDRPKCKPTAALHRCHRALALKTLCSTPEDRGIIRNTN